MWCCVVGVIAMIGVDEVVVVCGVSVDVQCVAMSYVYLYALCLFVMC